MKADLNLRGALGSFFSFAPPSLLPRETFRFCLDPFGVVGLPSDDVPSAFGGASDLLLSVVVVCCCCIGMSLDEFIVGSTLHIVSPR